MGNTVVYGFLDESPALTDEAPFFCVDIISTSHKTNKQLQNIIKRARKRAVFNITLDKKFTKDDQEAEFLSTTQETIEILAPKNKIVIEKVVKWTKLKKRIVNP